MAIGFQLYTVRGEFARDIPGTIKSLAQMGYTGIEFWDYAGGPKVFQDYSAADLRQILDDNGLKCCGMHVTLEGMAGDKLRRTIETNRILGSIYPTLVMAPDLMTSLSGIEELAGLLNRAAAECARNGMMAGYHCHEFDFARIDGRTAWEILFGQLDPKVNMQIDIGNCLAGGGDPIAMLRKFPGRSWTVHLKEFQDKTFDSSYFQEVFRLCETTCATRWYIVEMGGEEGFGFEVPRQMLAKLHRAGKE